ncbi:beta-1,3-galactosyltransferase 5-like, partial [Paramuricea clavata]
YASTNSCEEGLAVIRPNSHRNSPPKWTTRQSQRLNSSTVPRGCNTTVFVLIVVFSSPKNFEQRSIIRSTWAEIKDRDPEITNIIIKGPYTVESMVKTVFLLGQTDKETQRRIETESEYYNDLVIGSFTDSYGNLTLKTKLGLQWAQTFCKFEYYLKTDDDVFVYSKGLVKWLWQLPRERVYTGRCDFNKTVIRTVGHK